MKKNLLIMLSAALLVVGCGKKDLSENPFLKEWNTPYGTAPFDEIKNEHYMPAFEEAMRVHNEEIDAIIKNKEAANFQNTIVAIDLSGELLAKVSGVFFNMTAANTNEELQKIESEIGPILAKHSDEITMNGKLFEKVKMVWDNKEKENLNQEQKMLLEKTYKRFVRSGALLDKTKQDKLKKVNGDLTTLESKFISNLLKETKSYTLVIDKKEDLKGLPEWLIEQGATTAKENKQEGKWIYTLDSPSVFPFLEFAENRELREKIFTAKNNRCNNGGETDNKENIKKIANLRAQKAELLGYKTFADYILEERMLKTPEEVNSLLEGLLSYSVPAAKKDVVELQKLLDKDHKGATLEAWDWTYYANKLKKQKFNFDAEQTRP
ncbi:MAG: M3 family metallopeptidase, partial [Bacteroidales bacterium]